jgi:hypothetical protein
MIITKWLGGEIKLRQPQQQECTQNTRLRIACVVLIHHDVFTTDDTTSNSTV